MRAARASHCILLQHVHDNSQWLRQVIYSLLAVAMALRKACILHDHPHRDLPKAQQLGLLNQVESEVIQAMREDNLKELVISFDPKGKHKDLIYTWKESVDQKDMEHVLNQFLGKKHVSLTMKSNDGKTVQYEYQNRKRIKN